jgi:hypothetical protein
MGSLLAQSKQAKLRAERCRLQYLQRRSGILLLVALGQGRRFPLYKIVAENMVQSNGCGERRGRIVTRVREGSRSVLRNAGVSKGVILPTAKLNLARKVL